MHFPLNIIDLLLNPTVYIFHAQDARSSVPKCSGCPSVLSYALELAHVIACG
jgi:hypothetical protein